MAGDERARGELIALKATAMRVSSVARHAVERLDELDRGPGRAAVGPHRDLGHLGLARPCTEAIRILSLEMATGYG
jgi:hypothetical protein